MKNTKRIILILSTLVCLNNYAACEGSAASDVGTESETLIKITILVGSKSWTVTLYDNAAAQALIDQMPLTLNMSEMNGNEKYYYLPDKLPADSRRVGNIRAGDLMLYGSDCLVLFYQSFSSSYSYTRLGYIEDTSGLAEALGGGGTRRRGHPGNIQREPIRGNYLWSTGRLEKPA
ncbi:MAG: hypothetical protein LBQ88_13630 [Treponema sp.]|jgi:hypothetical protein|nr:hypothetical protein [Treponema sp.]